MCFYKQPEHELTEQEKLLAALIDLNHRLPVGLQIGMPLHLDGAIEAVDKLFVEHKLPLRDELISQLTVWRAQVEDGLKFAHQCDQLMRTVIQRVHNPDKRA